jgi:hypothetical protein
MSTAYTVVAVPLAGVLLLSAYTKLIRFERTTATLTNVGVTDSQFAPLAACEPVVILAMAFAALILRIGSA